VPDAVLLEQHADAAALGLNDLVLALDEGVEVDRCLALDLYAERRSVLHGVEPLHAGNHRLGGDTSPVQARAA